MSNTLPPINQALIPENVRAEGSKSISLYETALSFEGMLDQQLTQTLTETLDPSDSGGGGGSGDGSSPDAATSLMMQMLPQELSQALAATGGLGLAPQLYAALGGKTAEAPATGGATGHAGPEAAA